MTGEEGERRGPRQLEELLRDAWGWAYEVGAWDEEHKQLLETLDKHGAAFRKGERHATLEMYDAVLDMWDSLRRVEEAFADLERKLLDRVNELYEEEEAADAGGHDDN